MEKRNNQSKFLWALCYTHIVCNQISTNIIFVCYIHKTNPAANTLRKLMSANPILICPDLICSSFEKNNFRFFLYYISFILQILLWLKNVYFGLHTHTHARTKIRTCISFDVEGDFCHLKVNNTILRFFISSISFFPPQIEVNNFSS